MTDFQDKYIIFLMPICGSLGLQGSTRSRKFVLYHALLNIRVVFLSTEDLFLKYNLQLASTVHTAVRND